MSSFLLETLVFENKEQGIPNYISPLSPTFTMRNILLQKTFFLNGAVSQILIVWNYTFIHTYVYLFIPILLAARQLMFLKMQTICKHCIYRNMAYF